MELYMFEYILKVKTAIDDALRALPVDGLEALAVSNLLQFADILQSTLKVAIKEDPDRYNRFMPLTEVVIFLLGFQVVNSLFCCPFMVMYFSEFDCR